MKPSNPDPSATGSLTLVPTPIGNLGDITLRAIEVLRHAQRIVAEDTRRARKLLAHLGLDGSRLSRLDANASEADLNRVIEWVQQGLHVALVTDAGCPTISDPGSALVRLAVQEQVPVTALPGPSAITTAVALSGLVDGPFWFAGFLPRAGVERAQAVAAIASRPEPCVLFESPHRLTATLRDLAEPMPSRQAVVARELSKMHEEALRGSLQELAQVEREWLGEITIVLGPLDQQAEQAPDDSQLDRKIDELLAASVHTRVIAERVAAWSGRPKRDVYARVLERKRSNSVP